MNKTEIGCAVNSVLFTIVCFVAGLVVHNGAAWRLAILAFGVRTLSFMIQDQRAVNGLALAATMAGALAGVSLLFPW